MKLEDVEPGMELEISRKGVVTRLTVYIVKKNAPYKYAFITKELGPVYVDELSTITLLSEPSDPHKFGLRAVVNGQRYVCMQAFGCNDERNSLWKCDDESTNFYSWDEMVAKGNVEFVEDEEQWFIMS